MDQYEWIMNLSMASTMLLVPTIIDTEPPVTCDRDTRCLGYQGHWFLHDRENVYPVSTKGP